MVTRQRKKITVGPWKKSRIWVYERPSVGQSMYMQSAVVGGFEGTWLGSGEGRYDLWDRE